MHADMTLVSGARGLVACVASVASSCHSRDASLPGSSSSSCPASLLLLLQDTGRLEFEYLLRLNDAVYYNLACMTERMALLNVEADLRSQVIAQVVIELNAAAAEEIRTLIKEDKEDEARKIDPAKYQNIVDLDQIFRMVKKEEEAAEAARISREREKETELMQQQAAAAGGAIHSVPPGLP